MNLSYCRYQLAFKSAPNSQTAGTIVDGYLLRDGEGYACLQSWPSLGDVPVDQLLQMWSRGERNYAYLEQAMRCLVEDGEARKREFPLSTGLPEPHCYASLSIGTPLEDLRLLEESGFSSAKIKGGQDFFSLIRWLSAAVSVVPEWSWRIDFNASLSSDQTKHFWVQLSRLLGARLKYFEDPCPNVDGTWESLFEFGVHLASDRIQTDLPVPLVIKPAFQNWREYPLGRELVFTSNMQHPLGVAWDAIEAARALDAGRKVSDCGLLTSQLLHCRNEENWLPITGPKWQFPVGFGLGFDRQLEQMKWNWI